VLTQSIQPITKAEFQSMWNGNVVPAPSVSQEYGYTGRMHDSEDAGLMYFRAQYYSAEIGRFIGRDPLGYVDGYNLYGAYYVPKWLKLVRHRYNKNY
jgi:RHS repeat-associated protein